MRLPNRESAIIAREKLTDYLLNVGHKRGSTKARLLIRFGYSAANWEQLEAHIRAMIDADVDVTRITEYGIRYEVPLTLQTPSGSPLSVRTIWQVDEGTELPRLITLYPD